MSIMKKMNNFIISTILLIVGLVISYICFNHIYAWFGVVIGIATVVGYIYYVIKEISKLI